MTGAQLLKQYLARNGLRQSRFAEIVPCSPPLLSMWLSGARVPGRSNAFALQRATAGAVPASSWDDEREPTSSGNRKPRRSRRRRHARSVAQPAGRA